MGETCPTGEESDGEGMEDREGVTVRGAELDVESVDCTELGATDWVDSCTAVVAATTAENVWLLAWPGVAMDGLEPTKDIEGGGLGTVEAVWLLTVTVALVNTIWKG